jgi:uncharacterized membrane protein YeaQ/YmgE (transglycosylase-associated protein family)
VFGTIVSAFVSGFLIGGLARWAVPGPDPMPIWLTAFFGLAGSAIGGGITAAALHANRDVSDSDYFSIVMASIVATIALLVAYRRFVQKRPITGPDAHKPPTRGWGLRLAGRPRGTALGSPRGRKKQDVLRKLDQLHDQGVLSEEEYLAKRREVLSWE